MKENNNASTGGDILKFYYDFSPRQRVGIEYKLFRNLRIKLSIGIQCTHSNNENIHDYSLFFSLIINIKYNNLN